MESSAKLLSYWFSLCQRWLAILIGLCGLLSINTVCQAEVVDRIVAVVNNDIILLSELDQAMAPYVEKLKSQGYSDIQQRIFLTEQRPKLLEQLITDKLTDQQVLHYQISLSDNEVDATIDRIKGINKLSDKQLRLKLEMDGMSYDAFRNQVKEQMLRSKLVNREVKSKIVITDEDVRAYYNKHLAQYTGQTKYHLRQILMKAGPSVTQAERERVSQQMARVYDRLRQGEDFATLAKVYSQAPTAEEGGDIGVFEERLLTSQIKQALQGLQAHQFTPVLDTEQGFQIFYIEDVTHAGGKTLQEAKREIQDKLYGDIVDLRFQEWLKQLRDQAHIQIME